MNRGRALRPLDELDPNPGPDEAVMPKAPGPDGVGPHVGAQAAPASRDLAQRVDQLLDQPGTMLADRGPWVRWRPTARAEAGAGGRPRGPLDHLVVGVKDLVAVAGLPVSAGSRTRQAAPPEPHDAPIVRDLRAAGAVVAGTVALHELAFGVTGVNDQVGFPPHPSDRRHVPGGSSSGSAVAVAQLGCDLSVGTDTGGSVRIPAAMCGVVGFKPSRDSYPLAGVLPLAPSLDHVGLLARKVEVVALAHQVLTGEAAEPAPPTRLGVDRIALAAATGPVAAAVETALRALADRGCELVDVAWPEPARVQDASNAILYAEARTVHRRLFETASSLLGDDLIERLTTGAAISTGQHRAALVEAAGITAELQAALGTVDAVVGPTLPLTAPTIEAARQDHDLPRQIVSNTRLANLTGTPALTIPLPTDGLPIGLQILARSNVATLAVGLALARELA